MPSPPRRRPVLTAAVTLLLAAVTGLVALVFLGKIPLAPEDTGEQGTVFYVVPYHYGFAFYDRRFNEVKAMEVREGETVTLHVVPAQALGREAALAYAARTTRTALGDLAPGDPQVHRKILEDLELGNVEHIIGISAYPVYLATNVAQVLGGQPFRDGGPRTVQEAVRRGDSPIKTVTFTAKRVGAFDVICVDSGMDGAGTCGWGHKWMVAKEAFLVR